MSAPVDRPAGRGRVEPQAAGVCASSPPGPGRRAVVSRARRHARRTGSRLEILVDPADGPVCGRSPWWPVSVRGLSAGPCRSRRADARGAAGVLQCRPDRRHRVPHGEGRARRAAAYPGSGGVLALAPHSTDEVLDAAFDAAARHGRRCSRAVCGTPAGRDGPRSWRGDREGQRRGAPPVLHSSPVSRARRVPAGPPHRSSRTRC